MKTTHIQQRSLLKPCSSNSYEEKAIGSVQCQLLGIYVVLIVSTE